jgi:insulysin
VGSLLDPPEFQGLAHFTEHMLFYSSEKYPVEDEYSKVGHHMATCSRAYKPLHVITIDHVDC